MFLQGELNPDVSYSRHCLALHTLRMLVESSLRSDVSLHNLVEPVLNLAMDPFEDVRSLAVKICRALQNDPSFDFSQNRLDGVSKRMEIVSAKTGRHDHADAAGRLCALYYSSSKSSSDINTPLHRLDEYCSLTTKLEPGTAFPLHGLLRTAVHRIPGELFHGQEELVFRICVRVWALVQSELCVDSPETAAPESDGDISGPKDLLAYSWRALRDSSLLIQAVLKGINPTHQTLATTGSLCLEQLIRLRHRGAFSTVAQTFAQCCEAARTSANLADQEILQQWYQEFLNELKRQAAKLTRRSAGLPALLTALLSPVHTEFFDAAMRDLQEIAREAAAAIQNGETELALPPVHAINCMKDIIYNSSFKAISSRYIDELLRLATQSLTSNIWNIRNSGLMLLRACMLRLESNNYSTHSRAERSMSSQVSVATVTSLLSSGPSDIIPVDDPSGSANTTTTHRSEQIFAALELLNYVGGTTEDNAHLLGHIRQHLKSPIWAIRDHAARAFAGRLQYGGISLPSSEVLPIPDSCSENELHGCLLVNKYHIKSIYQHGSTKAVDDMLETLDTLTESLLSKLHPYSSPFTVGTLLDIANDSMTYILTSGRSFVDLHQPLLEIHDRCHSVSHPYCHSRLLLGKALFYMLEGSQLTNQLFALIGENALKPLSKEICKDADAAKYVVEKLQELMPSMTYAQWRLLDLHCQLVIDMSFLDCRVLVLQGLADLLETNMSVLKYFCSKESQGIRAEVGVRLLLSHTDSRDLYNATMRVWAVCVRLQLDGVHGLPGFLFDRDEPRSDFLELLQTGLEDETEFPTRLSAAQALHTCAPYIVTTGVRVKRNGEPPIRNPLTAISLVYDMLNDDDEEIRTLGEKTTASILDRWYEVLPSSQPEHATKPLCSLASREALMQWIMELLGSDEDPTYPLERHEVCSLATQRIVGLSSLRLGNEQKLLDDVTADSVTTRLASIWKSMNDLFAEERQNLYVDELQEIRQWARVLRRCGMHLDPHATTAVIIWISEGLRQVHLAINADDTDSAFPLGLTYNGEILSLFVRVISLAAIVCERLNDESYSGQKRKLNPQLDRLRAVCDQRGVHERLLQAFEAGISEDKKRAEPEPDLSVPTDTWQSDPGSHPQNIPSPMPLDIRQTLPF